MEVHRVDEKKTSLQLDYATLTWKEDDYVRFFKTLAYENMTLQYSLTIREWTKNLVVTGMTGVDLDMLFESVASKIKSEYLTSVSCEKKEFELLPEKSIDTIRKGLFVVPNKSQVGFEHIALLLNVIVLSVGLYTHSYSTPFLEITFLTAPSFA